MFQKRGRIRVEDIYENAIYYLILIKSIDTSGHKTIIYNYKFRNSKIVLHAVNAFEIIIVYFVIPSKL